MARSTQESGKQCPRAPDGCGNALRPALAVASLAEWRKWLRNHHRKDDLIWLVFRKGDKSGLTYADALDEAIAWGWIDSIVRRIDDELYARKFTPRRDASNWSAVNLRHLERLRKEDRMQPSGLAVTPSAERQAKRQTRPSASREMPKELESALAANAEAKSFFDALAPSYRRRYVGWVGMAKSPATRERRAAEAADLLARGVKSLFK
jgi:uncharacterized protein YdeI (YjbR/CyaY-like superfamily)